MPVSDTAAGSQAATLDTDHTLTTTTAPAGGAAYQLWVDKSALAGTEEVQLRLRSRVRAADPVIDIFDATFTQDGPDGVVSDVLAVSAGIEVVAILRQTGGTGRSFPWALRRIDGP